MDAVFQIWRHGIWLQSVIACPWGRREPGCLGSDGDRHEETGFVSNGAGNGLWFGCCGGYALEGCQGAAAHALLVGYADNKWPCGSGWFGQWERSRRHEFWPALYGQGQFGFLESGRADDTAASRSESDRIRF